MNAAAKIAPPELPRHVRLRRIQSEARARGYYRYCEIVEANGLTAGLFHIPLDAAFGRADQAVTGLIGMLERLD